eukprot:2841437-Pyramimonas_sp.AAC.1
MLVRADVPLGPLPGSITLGPPHWARVYSSVPRHRRTNKTHGFRRAFIQNQPGLNASGRGKRP